MLLAFFKTRALPLPKRFRTSQLFSQMKLTLSVLYRECSKLLQIPKGESRSFDLPYVVLLTPNHVVRCVGITVCFVLVISFQTQNIMMPFAVLCV